MKANHIRMQMQKQSRTSVSRGTALKQISGRLVQCTQIFVLMQGMELPFLYPAKRTILCAGGTERRFYPDGSKSRIDGVS